MDEKLKPLSLWRDDPHINYALDRIADDGDPIAALVEALVGLADRARNAEDFVLIHRLKNKNDLPA